MKQKAYDNLNDLREIEDSIIKEDSEQWKQSLILNLKYLHGENNRYILSILNAFAKKRIRVRGIKTLVENKTGIINAKRIIDTALSEYEQFGKDNND